MPIPTDKQGAKPYKEVSSQHLQTAAFEPAHFYELTVQWPHNRITYVADKEDSYAHLRSVAAKAEECKADTSLRIHASCDLEGIMGMDSDVADAILWREGRVRVRALEQFRKHAHKAVQHNVDALCSLDKIKEAADLVKPYSVYRVQADYAEDYVHKNVLAIDFDGVIAEPLEDALDHLGAPMPGAIEALHTLEQMGYKIGIMSAHCRTVEGEEEVRKWLDHYGAPFVVTTSTKIPASLYIDDRALRFTDWKTALEDIPKLAPIAAPGSAYQSPKSDQPESYQSQKSEQPSKGDIEKETPKESELCSKDASYLEWNEKEKSWACPACNKKTAFLDRVAATIYALIPGDKVNVRSVEGSTLGDAYLLYKANASEERALKASNLWLTYFPGGNYLPVAEELLTKIGHDDAIRRDALKIIAGKNVQIQAREDIPLRYDIDNIIEATLTEAALSTIPLDSVLVGMAARHQLTPEDLDVVTEACLSLVEPVKADLSPTDERLVNATRDALEESDAFFADAEQVPDEDEETQMVLGYLADEFNWSDELTDDEIVSTTKEVIANLREENTRMPRWVKSANRKLWEKVANEYGDKGYNTTISAFRSEYQKEKRSVASEEDRIDSETQDYTPTNQPSLTSVPESDYDVVRQQTEAEKDSKAGTKFSKKDLGCWIDGAFGVEHANEKLSVMVEEFDAQLAKDLLEGDPGGELTMDGVDDLADEAVEILQKNTEEGLIWIWDAGDLILTTEDQAEGSLDSLEPYRGTDIDNVQAGKELKKAPYAVINTAQEARDYAIGWQNWMSEQNLSYGELADWEAYFQQLAERFPEVKDEFVENGIIGKTANDNVQASQCEDTSGTPCAGPKVSVQSGTRTRNYCEKHLPAEIQYNLPEKRKEKEAILDKSIADLKLSEAQLKVVAGIRETIDDYTDSFLQTVGQFFTYDWDPGASWEVKEVKGKKMIVRKEPAKKPAKATRHAYQTGQVLKMYDGVMPVDVKVTALLGEDRYRVKSMIDSKAEEITVDELDLALPETQLFN